ncbi:MAG: MFS transporter, partial [Actinomycetota bacterium]|nr:MFS transporter [Actinomycetota bacterium]
GAIANATIGGDDVDPARLTLAVHRIFIGMVLVAVVMVALAALIPRSADAVTTPENLDTAPDDAPTSTR